jgi:hypothetical protein
MTCSLSVLKSHILNLEESNRRLSDKAINLYEHCFIIRKNILELKRIANKLSEEK